MALDPLAGLGNISGDFQSAESDLTTAIGNNDLGGELAAQEKMAKAKAEFDAASSAIKELGEMADTAAKNMGSV